jgi:hypothetical protein
MGLRTMTDPNEALAREEAAARALPDRIWLLPLSGDEGSTTWCDDPDPEGRSEHPYAVAYIRVDAAVRACEAVEGRMDNKSARATARLCSKAVRGSAL